MFEDRVKEHDFARYMLDALDPARMMQRTGMVPDPWQSDFLRSSAQMVLTLCTRQAGKSTTTSRKALHRACYAPGSLVLLLSPSLRQSGELFAKVMEGYALVADAFPSERETGLALKLKNGSRIVSLPGKEDTIRGYSAVDLLIIDEASRVPDELYFSVRPMLAVSRGQLLALTTPWGKRGWFFEEWTFGSANIERIRITADMIPRISPQFLENERRTLGETWFRQEYECHFVDTVDSMFSSDAINGAVSAAVKPLFSDEEPDALPASGIATLDLDEEVTP